MSSEINTSQWQFIGETSNGRHYEIERDIMGVVPHVGTVDTGAKAREALNFQLDHWRKVGHGGVVVIFFDRIASQDKEARRVYGEEGDPRLMRACALVGGSMLGRAIGSFLLGMSKPRAIPLKMFGDLESAVAWARQINRAASSTTRPSEEAKP
jgi:hypothetical protein